MVPFFFFLEEEKELYLFDSMDFHLFLLTINCADLPLIEIFFFTMVTFNNNLKSTLF